MKVWKDKQGKTLTSKEFINRWKEGIEGITPIQKLKTQMTAIRIQLLGIVLGLVVSYIAYENLWWVGIILIGALINTIVQYLGLSQQLKNLNKHEESCQEITLEDLMNTTEEDLEKAEEEEVIVVDGKEKNGMSESAVRAEDYMEDEK